MHPGLALLQQCDSLTLSRLLTVRPLMGGLLNHLSTDPPEAVLSLLSLLARRCLAAAAGAAAGWAEMANAIGGGEIAASVRAEAFGDVALQQLAEVVVLLEGFEAPEGDGQLEEQGEAHPQCTGREGL